MPGFVKIPRDISNFGWYTDANTVKVYVHLLLKASWTNRVWNGIVLQPGQVAISQEALATELKLTRIKVRTALRNLIDSGVVAKGIASTVANGLSNGVASKIANNVANRCTILNVYNSIDFEGENFDGSQQNSQQNSQKNTGSVANGLASSLATNVEYIECKKDNNIPPSNTLYYCPPKGETDAAATGDSEVKTDSVDSQSKEKKKVARKKKRSEELPDGTFEYIPVGQIAEYMKSNTVWFEAFCMNKHLDPEFVKRKIDEFAAHCADNGETEKDKRDCIRHFNNWLRVRQDRPPEQYRATTRTKHPATEYNNDQRFEIF